MGAELKAHYFLAANGTVYATGCFKPRRCEIYPELFLTGVKTMAIGAKRSLFLMYNGVVCARGAAVGESETAYVVERGAQAVSSLDEFAVILKENGEAWGYGNNWHGQLGQADAARRRSPILIQTGVKHISAGVTHLVMTLKNGTVFMFGRDDGKRFVNKYGRRLMPIKDEYGRLRNRAVVPTDAHPKVLDIKSVHAGYKSTMYITQNGTVYGSGYDEYGIFGLPARSGKLGRNQNDDSRTCTITGLEQIRGNVESVWHYTHSVWLFKNGSAYVSGYNDEYQLGAVAVPVNSRKFGLIWVMDNAQAIGGGRKTSFIMADNGTIYAAGHAGGIDYQGRKRRFTEVMTLL